MVSIFIVGCLWLAFAGTHIGLATEPIRGRIVRRVGEVGFIAVFYAVASVTFAALIAFYAAHRFDGPRGLDLGGLPGLRWLFVGIISFGFVLILGALVTYPRMPMAVFNRTIRAPYGLERITRHPFFAGVALFALAHMLMATHLIGTVFFALLATFVSVGAHYQDAKLIAQRGAPYRDYVTATSAVPFAAVLAGRQHVAWRELPWTAFGLGVLAVVGLRYNHETILGNGGLWVIITVVGGAAVAGLSALQRRRRISRTVQVAPADAGDSALVR